MTIWTAGHSNYPLSKLLEILLRHGIERVADVRTVPKSRHNPQFNREAMPAPLKQAGIEYGHHPGLGGLRHPRPDSINTGWREAGFRGYADHMQTADFRASLEALIAIAMEKRTAILCAEAVPWRCHRSLISDALVVRGIRVDHILDAQSARPHRLTSFASVKEVNITYETQLQLTADDSREY